MTRSRYAAEFPDFPASDMPKMPDGFEDVSWHNDAMPHFVNEGLKLSLWIDYTDESKREYMHYARFQLYRMDSVGSDIVSLCSTNEFDTILGYIGELRRDEDMFSDEHRYKGRPYK